MIFNYKNLRVTHKLLLFVLSLIVISITTLGYISSTKAKKALKESIAENLKNIADLKVQKLESFYSKTYENVSTLQNNGLIISGLSQIVKNTDEVQNEKQEEMDYFLSSYAKTYKYRSVKLLDELGIVVYNSDKEGVLGEKIGDPKDETFIKGQSDIFFSEAFKREQEAIIIVSGPIFSNKKLLGIVALELDMKAIYDLVQDTTGLKETGEILLGRETISGVLILNSLKKNGVEALDKKIDSESDNATPLINAVNGKSSMGIFNDYNNDEVIAASRFVPSFRWGLVAKMDTSEAFDSIEKTESGMIFWSIIILFVASLLSFFFSRNLVNRIIKLKNVITVLGEGNTVDYQLEKKGNDEIGEIIEATNYLSKFQNEIIDFAEKIGEGKFNSDTSITKIKGDLGFSLTNMSNNLEEVENGAQKRNWTTAGLAKFADILRVRDKKIEDLTDIIIANLIKYLNANQGSIFVVSDDDGKDEYLELIATYAWDRKKHQKKQILQGEGLVGRCWQEAEKIYLTNIPEDYINITSGLGEASPKCILIVPMKIEERVFGVIEIASFHEIENYQIEFIEKIAENIATTISNTRIDNRTTYLLQESKEMAEEMRAQEEEMRQNMEEMNATQESLEAKQKELEASERRSESIFENSLDGVMVCDETGRISNMNRSGRDLFELEREFDLEVNEVNIKELITKFNPENPDSFLDRKRRTKVLTINQKRVSIEAYITKQTLDGKSIFLGYIRNITKEIEKEQQIAENLMAMEELKSELKKIKS